MKNKLFILVGSRCSGKNYWADKALNKYPSLTLVRSNTTRPSRKDGVDERSYNFWTEDEFDQEIASGRLILTGHHSGFRYGLHIALIENQLKQNSGILPLMPDAAEMIYHKINNNFTVKIIVLQPTTTLLMQNIRRRGIKNQQDIRSVILEDAEIRNRIWSAPVAAVNIYGTTKDEKILKLFNPNIS